MREVVGIVGYGRFGRLWASILAPHFDVLVTDTVEQPEPNFVSLEVLCARAATVFLCVPINQFDDVVQSIAPLIRPHTVVLDTCSVKEHPARIMTERLSGIEDVTLIATHPMFGPDSAARGIQGLPMVLWRLHGSELQFDRWKSLFAEVGIRIVQMSPEEHDRLAAYSQGVTHYIGRVLQQLQLEPTPIDTAGFKILCSLVEQTCNDSWELFQDLQTYNGYTPEMRTRIEQALESMNEVLRRAGPVRPDMPD
ncbi:MAG TPA: prephenate dehydrogenase/arogenate dehydrogenase family protein [Longimicrobiales bacterium]|nr:prephenate dehydrogenase/arogenate dehydrogenase family protein [Longimicrobiales bacterium]